MLMGIEEMILKQFQDTHFKLWSKMKQVMLCIQNLNIIRSQIQQFIL